MTEEQFSAWALPVLLVGLVLFLFFIIWDLGKKSRVDRLGMALIFLVLGLGVAGFVFKEILLKIISV